MKKIKRVLSWVLTGAIAGSIVLSDATPAFSSILGNSKELVATPSNAKKSEHEESNSSNSNPSASKKKVATASNATKDEYKEKDSLDTGKEKSVRKSTKKATPSNATFHREFPTSDGITIVIEIEDASLPNDTKIQIKKVESQKNDDIKILVEDAIDEDTSVEEIYAYDISFWSDGEEFEPDGTIKVSFSFSDEFSEAQIKDAEIFHLQDNDSDINFMQKEIQDNNKISCYADGFSIYGVAMISAGNERIFKTVTEDGFTLSINDQYNKMPDDVVINAAKITGDDRQKLVELARERYETENTKISAAYFYKISFSSSIKDINNDFSFRITSNVPKSYMESVMTKPVMNAIESDMSKYDPYGRDFGEYGLDFIACDLSNVCPIISIVILKDDCIPIYTPDELLRINDNLAGDYILMADIDLSEMGDWEPIGGRFGERQFTGSLDGNGHSISNMTINIENDDVNARICAGLFGQLDGARIGRLTMINSNINVRSASLTSVGAIAGWSPFLVNIPSGGNGQASEIFDCRVMHGTITAEFDGNGNVGGIIGQNFDDIVPNITSCYSSIDINANAGRTLYAGGIVGSQGSTSNCENGGDIKANAARTAYVGGITGYDAHVEESVNTGEIDVEAYHEKSASFLEAIITEAYIGGIVGSEGQVSNSYNTGTIKAASIAINTHQKNGSAHAKLFVGGIVGRAVNQLSCCYNVGAIESTIDAQSPNGQTEKTDFVGGIASEVEGSISPEHCYYINSHMSGIGKAMPEIASNACKRLTSEEMKQQESFDGFDFDNIWIMGNANYLYPVFNTQAEIEWPIDPIDPSEELKIISCSLIEGPVNNDSDIVLKFNRAISDVIGTTNGEKCEIRVYISDETLFTWDDKYTDYSIDGDTVTLHGVFNES